jgi:hypothetical protein
VSLARSGCIGMRPDLEKSGIPICRPLALRFVPHRVPLGTRAHLGLAHIDQRFVFFLFSLLCFSTAFLLFFFSLFFVQNLYFCSNLKIVHISNFFII